MKKWSSFAVKSPTEIIHQASHPMEHERVYPQIKSHDAELTISQHWPQVQTLTHEQSSF